MEIVEALEALEDHIEETKKGHYAGDGNQCIDYIESLGILRHFALGNILKYTHRLRSKTNPIDALKIAHYALILYCNIVETDSGHDFEFPEVK